MPPTRTHRLPYLLYAVVFCACLSRSNAVVLAACLAGIAVLLWKVRQAGKLTLPYGIPLVIFGVLAALNLALLLLAADPGPTGPTETFVTFCDQVFQGEGQVMAPSGQEVTDTFVCHGHGKPLPLKAKHHPRRARRGWFAVGKSVRGPAGTAGQWSSRTALPGRPAGRRRGPGSPPPRR